MVSINNSGAVNICQGCGCTAFAPSCAITYTPSIPNIIVRDTSTYDGGDSLKNVVVTITDTQGNVKYGRIGTGGSGATFGTVTFSAGAVTGVPVSVGGTGYCSGGNGTLNITFTGGSGTGAAAFATVVAGIITSVTVTAGGTGYVSAPTPAIQANTSVISLSGMSLSGGINVHATVISTNKCIADLYQYGLPNTATLTTTVGDSADEVDKDIVQDTE